MWQGNFAEHWMWDAGRQRNDSEVWSLGLGNWVIQVSGQFSQYNNSKWNLIHSVS